MVKWLSRNSDTVLFQVQILVGEPKFVGQRRSWWVILFLGIYNSLGNFAPFFEIGTSLIIDGLPGEALLLPLMMFNFFFYMWNISLGFWDAVVDTVTGRGVKWDKTVRFTVQKTEKEAEK